MAPPWKKNLQSHEDHEIPTDQRGLRQKLVGIEDGQWSEMEIMTVVTGLMVVK